MSEEEEVLGVLAGWYRCWWCGRYFEEKWLGGLCGEECDHNQFLAWKADRTKWDEIYKKYKPGKTK